MKRYMTEGDFYVRIETDDDIVFHIFPDYEGVVNYCKINNIDFKNIRKYCGYSL